jgi:hypothetical protein
VVLDRVNPWFIFLMVVAADAVISTEANQSKVVNEVEKSVKSGVPTRRDSAILTSASEKQALKAPRVLKCLWKISVNH